MTRNIWYDVFLAFVSLVSEGGLEAASYRRVAARSGVSVSMLRTRWPSIGDLIGAMSLGLTDILVGGSQLGPDPDEGRPLAKDLVRRQLPVDDISRQSHTAWFAVLARARWCDDPVPPHLLLGVESVRDLVVRWRDDTRKRCRQALRLWGVPPESLDAETDDLLVALEAWRSMLADPPPPNERDAVMTLEQADRLLDAYFDLLDQRYGLA